MALVFVQSSASGAHPNSGSWVELSTLVTGGGSGSGTSLTQALTAASNGFTFSKSGTYTTATVTGTTPSGYLGQVGVSVVSSSGGNTTFSLFLPDGLDPITGSITFDAN